MTLLRILGGRKRYVASLVMAGVAVYHSCSGEYHLTVQALAASICALGLNPDLTKVNC